MSEMKRTGFLTAAVSLILAGALTGALARSGNALPGVIELSQDQAGNGSFLGVFLSDVTDSRARELKLPEVRGAVVGQVLKDSPAEKAGLKAEDVILSYNNEPVQNAAQVFRLLTETPAGRTVTLGLSRGGGSLNVAVVTGERQAASLNNRGRDERDLLLEQAEKMTKEAQELRRQYDSGGQSDQKLLEKSQELMSQAAEFNHLAEIRLEELEKARREGRMSGMPGRSGLPGVRQTYRLGAKTVQLSDQLGKYFNVADGRGVLVTEVEPGSAAARVGLKAGDCITAINGQKVQNSADVNRLFSEAGDKPDTGEMTIQIVRDRKEQTLKIGSERH